LKSTFRGAVSGTFNVAAFYNDYTNQQLLTSFAPVNPALARVSGVRNAGDSRISGFEVETSIFPFKGMSINASYAYLNTRFKQVAPPTPVAGYTASSSARAGDPLALAPKNKYSITATFVLPLDENIGRISFGATFTHTDRQYANLGDRNPDGSLNPIWRLQPRDILNLNATWASIGGKPVDLSFFATNVTKEKYYTSYGGLYTSAGYQTATLGEPRIYGFRLRYRFGD
jgi:iron complex outermembrane receptor protein